MAVRQGLNQVLNAIKIPSCWQKASCPRDRARGEAVCVCVCVCVCVHAHPAECSSVCVQQQKERAVSTGETQKTQKQSCVYPFLFTKHFHILAFHILVFNVHSNPLGRQYHHISVLSGRNESSERLSNLPKMTANRWHTWFSSLMCFYFQNACLFVFLHTSCNASWPRQTLTLKDGQDLHRKIRVKGFLGKQNTVGVEHMKEKVKVEILDGIDYGMILNTVRKNLGLAKHVERRNHKIFNSGVIYITVKICQEWNLILVSSCSLGDERQKKRKEKEMGQKKKKWRWKWLYHLSEAAGIKYQKGLDNHSQIQATRLCCQLFVY